MKNVSIGGKHKVAARRRLWQIVAKKGMPRSRF